jgi:hypothetical protein
MACDGAKVDYTGQYKNNGIKISVFFLIHPDVAVIPAVFSHGSSLLFF